MSDSLQFELVTPERLAYSAQVEMVEVPGEMGDFGVLPGHAPFMSMIRPGVVTVYESAESIKRFFVPAGYAEVNPEGCVVLAEHLRDMSEMDAATAAAELDAAQQAVQAGGDELAQKRAEKALTIAQALVEAVQHR